MTNLFPSIDAEWFRGQLEAFYDTDMTPPIHDMPTVDREALSVHLAGNLAMKMQAEALRCPECGEIRMDDDGPKNGCTCAVCKVYHAGVSYLEWEAIP